MEIRIARLEDAEAIISLDSAKASETTHQQFILDQINASACYVAVIDEKVMAYAVLNYKFYGNGWIEMLYVQPNVRRHGIGVALLHQLVNECRTEKLFTSTNQSNIPMQQLLTTLAFSQSGFIENLDEGDPELVYFRHKKGASPGA